jgi:hypothetical protein
MGGACIRDEKQATKAEEVKKNEAEPAAEFARHKNHSNFDSEANPSDGPRACMGEKVAESVQMGDAGKAKPTPQTTPAVTPVSIKEQTVPGYEAACGAMETRLKLPQCMIKELEAMVNEAHFKNSSFNMQILAQVFTRFGVSEAEFLQPDSLFQSFYADLDDDPSNSGGNVKFVLASSLPFCAGELEDKKTLLWSCLLPDENSFVQYTNAVDLLSMFVVLSTKTIPEMVLKSDPQADPNIVALIDCSDDLLQAYIAEMLPQSPREGPLMHRHEFDMWVNTLGAAKMFSSAYHRRSLLEFLAAHTPTPR